MTILEHYLILLEDVELDQIKDTHKTLRRTVKDYSIKNNVQQLLNKYRDTDAKNIPLKDKQIIDEYTKLVEKFSDFSKYKTEYETWLSNGKKGPKPQLNARPKPFTGGAGTSKGYSGWAGTGKTKEQFKQEYYRGHKNTKNKAWVDKQWKTFEEFADHQHKNGKHWNNRDDLREFFKNQRKNKIFGVDKEKLVKNLKTQLKKKPVKYTAVSVATLAAFSASYKLSQYYFNREYRKKCSIFFGNRRKKCELVLRAEAYEKQIQFLKKELLKAKTIEDPEKFKDEITKKINKLNKKIIKIKFQIKEL